MPDPEKRPETTRARAVTRRRLVGVASGALAAPMLPAVALAQEYSTPQSGTPVASAASAAAIDENALYELSQKLVGGGSLNRDIVGPLGALIGGDPALASGFEELATLDDPTSEGVRASLSDNAKAASTNILLYWYEGYFGDHPVENRAEILFGLPVWSTVPYVTLPTVCKGFGYWATEVKIDGDATPGAGS